jgi:hypothetical protein
MKYRYYSLLGLAGFIFTTHAGAMDVQLQFTNDTDKNLRPTATITYDQNGNTNWNQPIEPPTPFIAAQAQHMPADRLRSNISDYYLEYFELFDENNHYVTNCLESYLPVLQSAIVTFRLKQIGHDNPHYYCSYQIQYLTEEK